MILNFSKSRQGTGNPNYKHGLSHTPLYQTWADMKSRCFNPKDQKYPNYGARGITVCDRWLYSFKSFYKDMGKKPGEEYSIERINNDGNYEPSNCKWATRLEQAANTRRVKGYPGVNLPRGRKTWRVTLGNKYLATTATYEEGVKVRKEAERAYS